MKTLAVCLLVTPLFAVTSLSQVRADRIKVYLLGTFHFAQTDTMVYDVRDKSHQESIQRLADIVSSRKPDKIFIEKMPEWENENHIDSMFQEYRNGHLNRARNEIWQVAGRVARRLGHQHMFQCDHPGQYGLYYSRIEEYASAHAQKARLTYHGKGMTAPLTSLVNGDSLRNASDLLEYIRWLNSEEVQGSSHAHYINVYPQIGNTDPYHVDSTSFLGAQLTVDWYRRNILIYAKMINQLDYTERAIFLLVGNDHVPIIRNLFQGNPYFEVVGAEQWLGKTSLKIPPFSVN